MEETISLKEIMETIRKRLMMIVLVTVAAVALAAGVSYFLLTPMYQSTTQILVNQTESENQEMITSGDIRTNMDLIGTYNVVLTSPRILEPTLEELGLERSKGDLQNQITINNEGESQVVNINVEDESPVMAANIANVIANVFQEEITQIMNVDNVSILSFAEPAENPTSPNPTLNMAIAMVVGLMAGVGIAFLLAFLDQSIRTEDDVARELDLPILTTVPHIDSSQIKVNATRVNDYTRAKKGREQHGA